MNLLLDTHILIWLIEGSEKLSQTAKHAIADDRNRINLSIASLWEITIKTSLGKLQLGLPLEQVVENFLLPGGIEILPIHLPHLLVSRALPLHHRDPFDRLLISQAKSESLTLVSEDHSFSRNTVETLW